MATETIKPKNETVSAETLRNDMRKLTYDFKDVMFSIGEHGKNKLVESKEKVGSALRSFCESSKEKLSNTGECINERCKDAVEKSRKEIETRPFAAVFTALAAGLVAGMLLRRRAA
jgi:ElaB/YqjD/DUF883 family membrane-anchored ribosome-binding protein